MLDFKTGDLFEDMEELDAVAHGCNCRGFMGAGIAYLFAKRYPEMDAVYSALCHADQLTPGEFLRWNDGYFDTFIYNLMTQLNPGADARLSYIEEAFARMLRDAAFEGVRTIGIPRIGAGIGGLDWADVEDEINAQLRLAPGIDIIVYTLPTEVDHFGHHEIRIAADDAAAA